MTTVQYYMSLGQIAVYLYKDLKIWKQFLIGSETMIQKIRGVSPFCGVITRSVQGFSWLCTQGLLLSGLEPYEMLGIKPRCRAMGLPVVLLLWLSPSYSKHFLLSMDNFHPFWFGSRSSSWLTSKGYSRAFYQFSYGFLPFVRSGHLQLKTI